MEVEPVDSVYKLLGVDGTSESVFNDAKFLVWIDSLASDKDRPNPYDSVLEKLQKALNYDDAAIVKRLVIAKAHIKPGTAAANVMGALYKYWKSKDVNPATLLRQLVPGLISDLLRGPLLIWLGYAYQHLEEKVVYQTILQDLLRPWELQSSGLTKLSGSVKSQLEGAKVLDIDQPLPSNLLSDDAGQPQLAVESNLGGVKQRFENDGLWQLYDQKQLVLDRYEPLPYGITSPSKAHSSPPVVSIELNPPQRDVEKEKYLVSLLKPNWMAEDSIASLARRWLSSYMNVFHYTQVRVVAESEEAFKSIVADKIFEALCESWDKHALSPNDVLEFSKISHHEQEYPLGNKRLRTWMTYMVNTNRLSSMYKKLRSMLKDDEDLALVIAAAMDWKKAFRQPWFQPLFDEWNLQRKTFPDIFGFLELYDPLSTNNRDSPFMIVLYHYVTLADPDRVKQTLLLRAMLELKYKYGDKPFYEAYLATKGVLKQVYFELLVTPWMNEGITTNDLLQADKELKSYYDLKRMHPSMSDAYGKNLEVSVSENHQLY